jgi:NDP-sugar pyrophosphorylase family protein
MELVILAAGMGSRFGGLKQVAPMGPNDEFIIDYSIYDAIKAGFDKVVFIIKEENFEIFKETIGKRVEEHIPVSYVFQKMDDIPEGVIIPEGRVKPWGTAHAIYCARNEVKDSFIIINADDFYGRDAFMVAAKYLKGLNDNAKFKYANIGYQAINTITDNGSVKRGVLYFDNDNKLTSLVESKIEKENGKLIAAPLDDEDNKKVIPNETLVSMNMFAFTKDIMDKLEENFPPFMEANKNNLAKCEYLIPTVVSDLIERKEATCDVLSTTAVWYGVTYKEDKDYVVNSLKELVDKGEYPKGLWK